jgi:hypothetical protein
VWGYDSDVSRPPASVPPPPAVVLENGSYSLALSLSPTGLPVCENGICNSLSLCVGTPSTATRTFTVDVERDGDQAIVRTPGAGNTLVLTLRVATGSVTGAVSGAARDAGGQMVEASGSVTGGASNNTAIAAAGNIDGQMAVGDGSCSNNGHVWSLSRR